jgi:hypothetical protein
VTGTHSYLFRWDMGVPVRIAVYDWSIRAVFTADLRCVALWHGERGCVFQVLLVYSSDKALVSREETPRYHGLFRV